MFNPLTTFAADICQHSNKSAMILPAASCRRARKSPTRLASTITALRLCLSPSAEAKLTPAPSTTIPAGRFSVYRGTTPCEPARVEAMSAAQHLEHVGQHSHSPRQENLTTVCLPSQAKHGSLQVHPQESDKHLKESQLVLLEIGSML